MHRPEKVTRATTLTLTLLSLSLTSQGQPAMAQSAGTFTPVANMTQARADHTATLLTNGSVLLAGGSTDTDTDGTGASILATAELYVPSTATFIATGNMTTARKGHTATLLADGRVLIAGGTGVSGELTSAELYDPATGTFTATGSMSHPRTAHTATLLPDGRVLIAGGYHWNDPYYDAVAESVIGAERYDASTGMFTATGRMDVKRFVSEATLLTDGTVLFASQTLTGARGEVYHPSFGAFTGDGVPIWGVNPAGSLLMNGKVLISGGGYSDPGISFADARLYDPTSGTFSDTGSMEACRFWHSSSLLPDGTVLIAGGDGRYCGSGTQGFGSLANAEIYVPSGKTFAATGNLTMPRQNHTATLLNDGSVLIAGGFDFQMTGQLSSRYDYHATAEIYHPALLAPEARLLSLSGDGRGQGAILHAGTNRVASPDDPAIAGEALELYCTGLMDGSVIPPQVAVGGRRAEVLYFGAAPGFPGACQVNFRVPSGISPGAAVPVRLSYIGRPSNEVNIGVRE